MKQIINLTGKKVLVTGASSGIGRATAILLSEVGAHVVLTGRNETGLQQTLAQMDRSAQHFHIAVDLSDMDQVAFLIQRSVENDGKKFDGLVHCAGIADTVPLKLIDYEKQDRIMRINHYAFIELVKQITKKKYSEKGLSIVGISSIASYRGGKCQTIYSASKAAMDAAVITLSKELADKQIRVNSIRPGMIRTKLSENGVRQKGMALEVLEGQQLLGLGDPEDIANMAVFLLSPAAKFITGQNISVDGGGPTSEWF